jgi:WD40 repeat protein
MVGLEGNTVGNDTSRGLITSRRNISSTVGANAGLELFGRGRYLLGGWCGANSGVEIWQVEPVRSVQSVQVEMQLADMAAGADAMLFLPPGTSGSREDWAPHLVPVFDAAVCSTGHRVLIAGGRGVRALDLDPNTVQWRRREPYRNHQATVTSCSLSLDGETAISTDQGGGVNIWTTETGRDVHQLRVSTVPQCSRFIWQDHMVAIGDDRGRVICWELAGGRRHLQFQTHKGAVHRLYFDSVSGCLATAGEDSAARIWNLEQGVQVGADLVHRGPVHDVAITMDGRFALTCGADGYVGIWSMIDGRLLDSYFDGSPLYRLSVDQGTGAVVVSGGRSVKSLNVDWVRLRELASSASRSSVARMVSAGYAQPPASVSPNYAGQANQAPVGSILAARQTSEVSIPEQSSMRMDRSAGGLRASTGSIPVVDGLRNRGPAPAPTPSFGFASPSDPAASQFPSALPQQPARSSAQPVYSTQATRAVDPFAPRPGNDPQTAVRQADPFAVLRTAMNDPFSAPHTGDPFASARPADPLQRGAEPGPSGRPGTTVLGAISSRAAEPFPARQQDRATDGSFANGFFDGSAEAVLRPQFTPHQTAAVAAQTARDAIAAPAPRPEIGGRPPEAPSRGSLEDILDADRVQRFELKPPPPSGSNTSAIIVFLLALVVGFGSREVVFRYFMNSALPGELAGRPATIDNDHGLAVDAANTNATQQRAAVEAQIADVGQDGTMTASEIERVRARLRRRFDDIEIARQTSIAAAATARLEQLGSINPEREAIASTIALQGGAGACAVVLLVGLIIIRSAQRKRAALAPRSTERKQNHLADLNGRRTRGR